MKTVTFVFEVSDDWKPQSTACWIDCPFRVCTQLGKTCNALTHKICPFKVIKENCENKDAD